MSRNLIDDDYYVSHGGKIPVKWTAPEALVFRKYSSASDVWSYGCLLYEIWSLGHKPFEEMSTQEVRGYYITGILYDEKSMQGYNIAYMHVFHWQ